jgi:hypothetical protein
MPSDEDRPDQSRRGIPQLQTVDVAKGTPQPVKSLVGPVAGEKDRQQRTLCGE